MAVEVVLSLLLLLLSLAPSGVALAGSASEPAHIDTQLVLLRRAFVAW